MSNVVLKPGTVIKRGQSVPFGPKNRRARLTLQQRDGNLVLYADKFALWYTGINPASDHAVMQPDGNFVLYDRSGAAPFKSKTSGHPGAVLKLQDDGNMVVYHGGRALWSTNTWNWTRRVHHPGPFENLSPAKLIAAAADVVSAAAPFVKTALSLVPGIGTGINMALGAAEALAKGRPLTDAFVDGLKGAIPGGPAAKAAFDSAVALAKGQRIDEALLAGAKAQLPPVAQKAFDVGLAVAHGRNLQDVAIDQVKSMAADQIKALKVPLPSGVHIPIEMKNGAEIGYGVLHSKTLTPAAALAVRAKLAPNAQVGFDRVMSMRALKHARRGSPHTPRPLPSFKGATFITADGRATRIGAAWLV